MSLPAQSHIKPVDERTKAGKLLRERCPLKIHGDWKPFAQRVGQRVVAGQRLMQAASDPFLGWMTRASGDRRHFYVRQLRDAKVKPVVELMKPRNPKNYARLCGWALARAHARSGDAVVLAGYLGKNENFEDALSNFAVAYADQNERDHATLIEAIRSGRIEARPTE